MFHHTYAFVCFANIPPFCAGELPKELGNLVNLTTLYLFNNEFRGELYVPSACSVLHSHFGQDITELCVCVHSDGRREDGTQGEAPGLHHLVLRCGYVYILK